MTAPLRPIFVDTSPSGKLITGKTFRASPTSVNTPRAKVGFHMFAVSSAHREHGLHDCFGFRVCHLRTVLADRRLLFLALYSLILVDIRVTIPELRFAVLL